MIPQGTAWYWWQPLFATPPILFKLETQPQDQCPLFSSLPAELRTIIFEYTLTDYESSDYFFKHEDRGMNLLMRPDCRPRRSTYTQLLRTCQRVYSETWLMPFIFAEHMFYYSLDDTRFRGTNEDHTSRITYNPRRLQAYPRNLEGYVLYHEPTFHIPKVDRVRFYFHPDDPYTIYPLSDWIESVPKKFGPRCVTFSICYKIGGMRRGNRMYDYKLRGDWVNRLRFPTSVTRIRMELGKFTENPRLGELVSKVISKWFFRREDGVVFRAAEDDVVYRRWVAHDPTPTQLPRTQQVYDIPMVIWKPVDGFNPFADGYECPDLDLTRLAKRVRRPLADITRAVNGITAHGSTT